MTNPLTGKVALTKAEAKIIQLLLEADDYSYGYDLVVSSRGALKLGSIYVLLTRMAGKNLIDAQKVPEPGQTVPRRMYRVTDLGKAALANWRQ